MDLKELRDRALEATTRFFVDRDGILPDQEGEEWEAEYRRQYDLVKRHAPEPYRAREQRRATPGHAEWPELAGSPAEKRWAAELRGAHARLARGHVDDRRGLGQHSGHVCGGLSAPDQHPIFRQPPRRQGAGP